MNFDRVGDHFEKEAFEYDGLIPKLIPKYHEQNETILKLLPFRRAEGLKVLDLGCGKVILQQITLVKDMI